MSSKGIVKRSEDFSKWYNELVLKADLAEHSDVRGCMIIKPYGYAIWEKIKDQLDIMFKETGHQNAYFPLLIPKSYLSKEAAHVEGFAKECAVVTHYRLKNSEDGTGVIVDPEAKLEEELIIRPTSETIIWNTYKKWIQSYRDLPILVNQWANVVRWEMRTRLFLRTSEFLWQEGHTAHATKIEAVEETEKMLEVYAQFVQEFMAVPVIKGVKSENERFAGAEETYCIEALMQDGKALQAGTSHFLGQNFAKAFDVSFADKEGNKNHVWATSWGVSTRLMGALVMTHSDDKGLVLPPKLAPIQVVIVPIYKNEDQLLEISEYANSLINELKSLNISVKFDNDGNKKPGWKFAEYEMKGIPLRIAIGPRDMENQTVELARRDNLSKSTVSQLDLPSLLLETLNLIQNDLFTRSSLFLKENTFSANSIDQMIEILDADGGFIEAFWNGDSKSEHKIKELTKATIRCIPLNENQTGNCILTGEPNSKKVIFARAY
jgi:prolyl-tRNA synthetase